MKIGDIVKPIDEGNILRSGCNAYGAAIVGSIDPFILVSEHADMVWSTRTLEEFKVVGEMEDKSPKAIFKHRKEYYER